MRDSCGAASECFVKCLLGSLRKRLIAASLRANPASGCSQPPDFTLDVVAPIEASAETAAWQERYLIKCKPDVQRSFLLISALEGRQTQWAGAVEITPWLMSSGTGTNSSPMRNFSCA